MRTSLARAPPGALLLDFRPSSAPTQWVAWTAVNPKVEVVRARKVNLSSQPPFAFTSLHHPCDIVHHRPLPGPPCWRSQSTSDALPPRGIARSLASQISHWARSGLRSTITPSPARSMCSRLLWSCCIWGRYGVGGCIRIGELGKSERITGRYLK